MVFLDHKSVKQGSLNRNIEASIIIFGFETAPKCLGLQALKYPE